MNINLIIENESTSEILVQEWDSCALKAVSDFSPNTSLYLTAVKASPISAQHAFKAAHINNWIYVLV